MKRLRNEKGQMIIEMVLMMTVLLGAATFISSQFRETNFIAQLVSGPWKNLAGMIQNGVWAPPSEGMTKHPTYSNRLNSPHAEKSKD